MDKCTDKFCDLCGHHLYTVSKSLWCNDCHAFVLPENAATFEQVSPMRAAYDKNAIENLLDDDKVVL